MYYCGIEVGPRAHHLCALREVRTHEPPVRLTAAFYEHGPAEAVIARVRAFDEAVVAIAAPMSAVREGRRARACDHLLDQRGIPPRRYSEDGAALFEGLADLGIFDPGVRALEGNVPGGAFREWAVFETNVEAVFCALQNRRVPARRHPLGIQRRIEELENEQVIDEGGDLWHRRIDELEAAAAALCAHRFAVGHARWVGDPDEGVIVLPGSGPLREFTTDGVLPPVVRLPL